MSVIDVAESFPRVSCDQFVASADRSLTYRIPHDTFPILTDPEFVFADDADFMRPDDWVIGVRTSSEVRCYAAHMLDNVHVVNDTIDGNCYAVAHCEICCSNAVFLATLDGRRLTFGTGGLFGGTLALFDEQTRSLWSHGMGVAFEGPLTGRCLTRVESYQSSYAEWVALHPGTKVMVWPRPPQHPDCRHGHGADAWFAQPGIELLVLRTMAVQVDDRLPENEIVVSVFTPNGHAALPLQDVQTSGGLLRFCIGGDELVALSGGPDSALSGTFHTHLRDHLEVKVTLELREGRIVDTTTESMFRVDGEAVSGPLAGQRLDPLPTLTNKWHSLICFLPDIPIVRGMGSALDEDPLRDVLASLRGDGFSVETTRRLFALELPPEALCGFDLLLNGEPFRLLLFSDESSAQDQLLWTRQALQAGAVVLISTPPRYADWSNTKRRREGAIAWSRLVHDPALRQSLTRATCGRAHRAAAALPSLSEFVRRLRGRGVDVVVGRSSYRETLPVGALVGMVADVAGDPFIVLRFENAEAAAASAPLPEHSILAGHLIVQSDPPEIYANQERGTQRRPDASVSWSPLLSANWFVTIVLRAAGVVT